MKFLARIIPLAVLSLVATAPAPAQPGSEASGHWEGAIQVPDGDLKIEVDLAKNEKGLWIGTISIAAQNLKAFPLANVAVEAKSVGFAIKGIPGDPTFQGNLSADGKSISGTFTQGGGSIGFSLTRTGDAKFEPLPKSTAITKDFEGIWEGALDANGKVLRLILKMANQADGTAAGSVVSVDQGGAELPITTIAQNGSNLKFEIRMVSGAYTGDLNKEATQIAGQWTQGPGTLPLTFKRPVKQ
jgi:hypothetical protein